MCILFSDMCHYYSMIRAAEYSCYKNSGIIMPNAYLCPGEM